MLPMPHVAFQHTILQKFRPLSCRTISFPSANANSCALAPPPPPPSPAVAAAQALRPPPHYILCRKLCPSWKELTSRLQRQAREEPFFDESLGTKSIVFGLIFSSFGPRPPPPVPPPALPRPPLQEEEEEDQDPNRRPGGEEQVLLRLLFLRVPPIRVPWVRGERKQLRQQGKVPEKVPWRRMTLKLIYKTPQFKHTERENKVRVWLKRAHLFAFCVYSKNPFSSLNDRPGKQLQCYSNSAFFPCICK